MRKHLAGLMTLALIMSGCASAQYGDGTPIPKDSISRIEKGRTTRQEVESLFGKPRHVALNADGSELLQYSFFSTKSQMSSAALIPVVGMFLTKAKGETKQQLLQVLVRNNVVVNYSYTENGSESESGFGGTKVKSQ